MASIKSISAELVEEISRREHCQYVDLFPRSSPMSSTDLRMFRKRTDDRYLVETDSFYSRKGRTKPDGIYKLFGKMVNKSADEIRDDLVQWANRNRAEVTEAGTVMLNNDKKDYSWWILTTTHKNNPVDELSLWGLCKMLFKHAVVYTPDYTWTTLRDKSLDIVEIDKICDVHLAYMGYGKFASITPIDTNVTVGVQPTLQTLSVKSKTIAPTPTPKQPISRTRHGQHPTRTTSAHINYFNLNQGDGTKERKSPRKQKRKTVSSLTLRTPSESRLASQIHIEREKEKHAVAESANDTDIQITATLPPDDDGTAFIRTPLVKPSAKTPQQTDIKSRKNLEHEKDEHPTKNKSTKTAIPDEVMPPDTQHVKEPPAVNATMPTPTNKITTVAEIHVCEKHFHLSQHLLPLLNPPDIKRENAPNRVDNVEPELVQKKADIDKPASKSESIDKDLTSPDTTPKDDLIMETSKHETDEQASTLEQETKVQKKTIGPIDNITTAETDEQHAADGLLMLQELANFDNMDVDDDINSQLVPIGTKQPTFPLDEEIADDTVSQLPTDDRKEDDTSDETITYDVPDLVDLADPGVDNTAKTTSEQGPRSKLEHEKDEQTEKKNRDKKDKKGTLVIREVGLKKRGTQEETDNDTPMPTITSSGKVRCNFCRRDFNTLSEQKQHMSRRHPEQLREQEEKRKREKDERKREEEEKRKREKDECEQFKLAIEMLKEQESAKKKKQKHKETADPQDDKKNRKRNPRKKSHEKDEPPAKRSKEQDDNTNVSRHYYCASENCGSWFNSQAELNRHHKNNHPPVICTVCKKVFSTPNTLDRHMYKHRSTLECQYCDEKFAFQSELELHLVVHENEPSFFCKSCTRSFMRVGDLREHEESHTGNIHYCTVKGCDFSATLKRYVRTHLKTTHAEKNTLPYPCSKCDRKFKFYEQRKRHIADDH